MFTFNSLRSFVMDRITLWCYC